MNLRPNKRLTKKWIVLNRYAKNQLPTKLRPIQSARFWQSMNISPPLKRMIPQYSTIHKLFFSIAWLLKSALHGNSIRIKLVVSSKISPCVIRYYLFDMTSKSRIWLFGIEHVPIPNDKQSLIFLFLVLTWVWYLFTLYRQLNVKLCTFSSTCSS